MTTDYIHDAEWDAECDRQYAEREAWLDNQEPDPRDEMRDDDE